MTKIKKLLQKIIQIISRYKRMIIPILIIAAIVYGTIYILGGRDVQYENSGNGSSGDYKFSYLGRGWHRASEKELTELNVPRTLGGELLFKDAVFRNRDQNSMFGIIIQEMPGAKIVNREESIKQMDKENSEKRRSFNKIEAKQIDFLGQPAIDYEMEYSFIVKIGKETKETRRRERQIIFLANEKIYRLIFSSPPERYESSQESFDKIFNSFELVKK